jgi:hypothetical protein
MTTHPTAASRTWSTPTNIDRRNSLTGVSCPSTLLCVAVDVAGNVVVGTPPSPATPAQIKASLLHQIAPHGKAAKIAALLKQQSYLLPFKALTVGSIVIDWYYLPNGAHLASKRRPVLVAKGKATVSQFSRAGTLKIAIELTTRGNRLLKHAVRLRLTARGTFTSSAARRAVVTKQFMLSR